MKRILRASMLGAGALAACLFMGPAPATAADEIVIGLSYGRTGLYSTINKTTEVAVEAFARDLAFVAPEAE